MSTLAGLAKFGFQVGKSVLNIAASSIQAAKRELEKLVREYALDPIARWKREESRAEAERRQLEIDAEMVSIHERVKRDGWTESLRERFEALRREYEKISLEFGPRETASIDPDDYEGVIVDPAKAHILEWHAGQHASKNCPKCGMPLRLQWSLQASTQGHLRFFWGCTGYYKPYPMQCRFTEPVTDADAGALIRRDNEAFAMSREEMLRRTSDEDYRWEIGNDLRALRGQPFDIYRCPIHGRPMKLEKKKKPVQLLDVWHMRCPSMIWMNGSWERCSQMVKIKSVAQVLAVREFGTGRIF